MDNNLYSAPHAGLQKEQHIEVPNEISRKIKGAWLAGTISLLLTLVFTLISLSGTDILGLDAYAFVDIAIMAALTFGIYRKSRTCAVLMLLFFLANKVLMWAQSGSLAGLPLALVFLWFYTMGVVGTFQYHAFMKAQRA